MSAPSPTPVAPSEPPATAPARLMSVDALRGFDMLWIVGAGSIVGALETMSPGPVTTFLTTQLKHVKWEGFRFYDLIFPLFLFIVGVSLVFSLDRAFAEGGRGRVLWRVVRRSVLLFALGVFYYGGFTKPWPDVALGGVLPRIAACYFFAALIYTFVRGAKGLAVACAALLIGYWALLTFVPFPDLPLEKPVVDVIAARLGTDDPAAIAASVSGRVRGLYEEPRNLANYFDFLHLRGRKVNHYYINEGLLSTLPSIALPLFGALAALLFKNERIPSRRKIAWLLGAGAVAIALGWAWSFQFPLIKRIWTSSFVLVAGGCSALLMAAFYYLVDVRQWRGWCQPFVWIGCNPLTIYIGAQFVSFPKIAACFVGGDVRAFFESRVAKGFGELVLAVVSLVLLALCARFLHQRRIFLRV